MNKITYEIECEQDQSAVEGNFASGDDAADKELEDTIASRLDRGDVWAWCCVRVKATAENGAEAYSSWLGGCCYEDAKDFEAGPYYTDLCVEAADELLKFEQSDAQTIQTKYIGPSNRLGARIKVWTQNKGCQYTPWDHARKASVNHAAAARAYAADMGWTGRYVGGQLPDGKGYLFVYAE